jgi:hypothetical protein
MLSPAFDLSTIPNPAASFVASSSKPPIPSYITIMSQEFSIRTDSSVSTATTAISARPYVVSDRDRDHSSSSLSRSAAGHVGGNGSPPEPGSTAAVPVSLLEAADDNEGKVLSVWDFQHVQKLGSTKADASWTCLWCNLNFKHWNATKALYHLAKVSGKDVRTCKVVHDRKSKEMYRTFLSGKDKSHTDMKVRNSNFEALVGEGQQSLAVMFESNRKRSSGGGGATGGSATTAASTIASTSTISARQRVLGTDMTCEASSASQLTMAIADFIHSTGLPFSATQGTYFNNILKFSRNVPFGYKPPSRNTISTTLLEINYKRRMEK